MSIADVLHHKGNEVVRVRATDTVQAAVQLLSARRIGAVVVEDAWMRIAGIFSERDLLNAIAAHGDATLHQPVEEFMSAPVISCAPTDRVESAMATMTLAKIRHLPVMENGRLIGIVSIGDLVKHRLDEKALEADVLLDLSRMRV
jgi:CBS domain-containing protein